MKPISSGKRLARLQLTTGATLPAVHLEIHNGIPLGKGLGSSAAALTAGVVIADSLLALGWTRERILDEAARLEGHPDNVAACVLGGITVSAIDDAGHARAIRFELPEDCAIALVIPDFVLPTSHSRAVLPATYSREDTIFNLQRTGLLVGALATGRTDMLSTALCDRVHQPFRAKLVPGLAEVLALRRPDLFGCVLSGAGPSILVFLRRGADKALTAVEEVMSRNAQRFTVVHTAIAPRGYELKVETSPIHVTSL